MWGSGEYGSALGSGSIAFNNTTSFQPQDNLSLSCAARNIQGSVMLPYSETAVIIARVLHASFTFSLMLIGGLLNLIVIVLVAKYKRLRTVSFGIALEMVAFNILASVFISLFSLITTIANRWVFTEYVCSLVGMAIFINAIAKTLLMLIFVIDRFLSVFYPFTYPKYQTRTVVILSIVALVFGLMMNSVGYFLDCFSFIPSSWNCIPSGDCNKNCSVFFMLNGGFVALLRILSFFLFGLLFMKARKAKKRLAITAESVGKQQSKYNWKATITFFMMFISLFITSIPSIATVFFTDVFYGEEKETSSTAVLLTTVALYIVSLNPITDPIIILRNGDVREILKEIKAEIIQRYTNRNESS